MEKIHGDAGCVRHGWALVIVGPLVALLAGAACSAPQQAVEQTIQTPSYRVRIIIGPTVSMPASAMTMAMTMTDRGQPVNHHMEIHVHDIRSGSVVREIVLAVAITDQATGTSRDLSGVMACMTLQHRDIEPHFGDNLYLADGKYMVTVHIGDQIASFESLVVTAAG